jgi:hypothetical protein
MPSDPLLDALRAAGYTVTPRDADTWTVTRGAFSGTLHLADWRAAIAAGADPAAAAADLVATVTETAELEAALDSPTPALLDQLRPHLVLTSPATAFVTRARFGPLAEALALDLPTQFACLSRRLLADWHLDPADAWRLADARAHAAARPPDDVTLIDGTRLWLWVGSDAADQAWTVARTQPLALLACPVQEIAACAPAPWHPALVAICTRLSDISASLEPTRPLVPAPLVVRDGAFQGMAIALHAPDG